MTRDSLWRGAAWLSVGSFVSKLIGAVYRIFLPRVLGDYGVGLFQMAYPLYAVILAISVNGIPTALSKLIAEKLSQNDQRAAESLGWYAQMGLGVVGIGLATAMELGAPWIARVVFSEPHAVWSIRAMAPALIFVSMEAGFRGYFQGYQEMVPTAVSQILEQVSRVAVMFPLAYQLLPYGIAKAAAGATLGAPIGAFVGLSYLILRRVAYRGIRLHGAASWRDLARLVLTALPMSLSGLLFPLMLMADSVFVPIRLHLTGMSLHEATAQFGQLSGEAMPLINLTMVIGAALAVSLVPAIAQAVVEKRMDEAHTKVRLAIRMVWVMGLPMAGGLIVLAQPLTQMLYGKSEASAVLQVLALGAAVLALQQVLGSSLQGAGYGWIPVKNLMVGAGVKFGLTWWLTAIPDMGIRGAALGTILAALVTAYLNWRAWTKITQIPSNVFDGMWWPLAATVAMALLLRTWMLTRWVAPAVAVGVAVPLGAAIYGVILVGVGEGRELWALVRTR